MRQQKNRNYHTQQIPTFHIENFETSSFLEASTPSDFPDTLPPPSSSDSNHLCSIFLQTCFALGMGSVAACSMALSLATDRWLFTREPYIFSQEELDAWNITDRRLLPRVEVMVRSGLWRVCTTGIAGSSDLCMPIDYTQLGSGRLSGAPTCMAVVGAIRYSTPAFVTALLSVTIATILLFVGVVQKSLKTLFASVLYVTTGLCLAIGIIIYISAINDEVGYSTRKSTHIDFHYNYGWSFFSVCLSFLVSEGAAVLSTLQHLRTKARRRRRRLKGCNHNTKSTTHQTAHLSHDALRIWTSSERDSNRIHDTDFV